MKALSCPLEMKKGRGGYDEGSIGSHLRGKVSEAVTMKAPSCPLEMKKGRGGYDEGSIVPT